VRNDYEQCLKNQKERIIELRDENKELSSALEMYKNSEHYISNAITRAEETAQVIIAQANAQAQQLIEQARREAQALKDASEGCYQRLHKLRSASESIHKAVTHALEELPMPKASNVRPFISCHETHV